MPIIHNLLLSGFVLLSLFFNHVIAQTTEVKYDCVRSLKTPPPQGIPCGRKGKLQRPALIRTFVANAPSPFVACRDACMDLGSGCGSFSIQKTTRVCRLFSKTLAAQKFKKQSGASLPQFYGRACFTQTCTTIRKTTLTDPTISYDDVPNYWEITPPFPVRYSNREYQTIYMSPNGFLSFGATPLESWDNLDIPTSGSTSPSKNYLPSESLAAFWDDLYIPSRDTNPTPLDMDLSWTSYGPQNRRLEFRWRARRGSNPGTFVDVVAAYAENQRGVWEVTYERVDSMAPAITATTGAQSLLTTSYSFTGLVGPGLCLKYRTEPNGGIFTDCSIPLGS